jgi:hypothetical protein
MCYACPLRRFAIFNGFFSATFASDAVADWALNLLASVRSGSLSRSNAFAELRFEVAEVEGFIIELSTAEGNLDS